MMNKNIYDIYLEIKRRGWKCPHCGHKFKNPIEKMIAWGLLGNAYAFFQFCPKCKKELFSDGKLIPPAPSKSL